MNSVRTGTETKNIRWFNQTTANIGFSALPPEEYKLVSLRLSSAVLARRIKPEHQNITSTTLTLPAYWQTGSTGLRFDESQTMSTAESPGC